MEDYVRRERLTCYREQRDKALLAIAEIEDGGRRIYDPPLSPMNDVTALRLAYLRKRAKLYDRLMALWQRNQSEPRDT